MFSSQDNPLGLIIGFYVGGVIIALIMWHTFRDLINDDDENDEGEK